jgi:hypothetical protein
MSEPFRAPELNHGDLAVRCSCCRRQFAWTAERQIKFGTPPRVCSQCHFRDNVDRARARASIVERMR